MFCVRQWQMFQLTFTFTYHLHAMWHIRPQHSPANQLCRPLRDVYLTSSIQLFLFLSLPSFSMLGLPSFRRLSGVQVNAGHSVLQFLFGSFLVMWPMNFHLLLRTSALRFSISVIWRTLFVIVSYQLLAIYSLCLISFRIIFLVEVS